MPEVDQDAAVANPTWYADIRYFFTHDDVDHMGRKGIDLGTYDGVVANAVSVYAQTESGAMPPDPAPKWSPDKVATFLNWITTGFPLGTPPQPGISVAAAFESNPVATRIRKDVSTLAPAEIDLLKKAFRGVMARDAGQDDSYFAIAGVHWFPAIDQNRLFHCLHHEDRFLAWHRMHLARFEDALRSVPGCANVTLPYWDITSPPPDLIYEEPFAAYTLQASIGHGYDPLTTSHYARADIERNVAGFRLADQIALALRQPIWEQFNKEFWKAHDNGHVSCGTTMLNQDISAFDPIFWLFHCNLDRIWLQWQKLVGALTVTGFKSTCSRPTTWIDLPAFNQLPPFAGRSADAIAMTDVDYEPPQGSALMTTFENKSGNVLAARGFRIDSATPLSVMVKDINRAGIPGSFVVHLLADGEDVASQAFFQPSDPAVCPSCSENANVSVDFRVDPSAILDKQLSVELHVPAQQAIGTRFPISKAGTPTINVRHLLEGE